MGMQVCLGATLMCSFGLAPSTLTVLPTNLVNVSQVPAANIMDNIPMTNVMPFGLCTSPTNPEVAAATAAAMGTPTPMPCVPVTPAPWTPGAPTVNIGKLPALDNASTLQCIWGGAITIVDPGQTQTMIA